jgi:glyoxylate reductase
MRIATTGLRVLVLGDEDSVSWHPWGRDVMDEVARTNKVVLVDRSRPLGEQVASADAVVDLQGEVDASLAQAAAGQVQLWQFVSVGYDHFDVASLLDRGVPAACCAGSTSASGLAELALMLSMMVLRRYAELDASMRSGEESYPIGRELQGRTLLIIGLGASGQELAVRARAFGMHVIGVRRAGADPAFAQELGLEQLARFDELDSLLPRADVVSLHVPLTADTRHLLSRKRFFLMRPGSIVVNVSRGGLIDELGLIDALRSGNLAGAGLDVLASEPVDLTHPLLGHPRVILTPHIAGATEETSLRRARFVAENLDRIATGQNPQALIFRIGASVGHSST